MKKKDYQKPTMQVDECEHEQQLLAGSGVQSNTVEDYYWNEEEEE